MTLTEITAQLYDLTKGHINGENFSKKELCDVIQIWLKTKQNYILQVELPDGLWLCEITKNYYGYDYYIPDTRSQENHLYGKLGVK